MIAELRQVCDQVMGLEFEHLRAMAQVAGAVPRHVTDAEPFLMRDRRARELRWACDFIGLLQDSSLWQGVFAPGKLVSEGDVLNLICGFRSTRWKAEHTANHLYSLHTLLFALKAMMTEDVPEEARAAVEMACRVLATIPLVMLPGGQYYIPPITATT